MIRMFLKSLDQVTLLAWLVTTLGYLAPLPGIISLYLTPVGTAGRPMGFAVALFCGGLLSPLVAATLAYLGFRLGGRNRWLGTLAGLASLANLPLYVLVNRWIIRTHQLILLP